MHIKYFNLPKKYHIFQRSFPLKNIVFLSGDAFCHCIMFVLPEDTKSMPTQLFSVNECFESNVEEDLLISSIRGKCSVLTLRDYQSCKQLLLSLNVVSQMISCCQFTFSISSQPSFIFNHPSMHPANRLVLVFDHVFFSYI